jgi:hypothetical protein
MRQNPHDVVNVERGVLGRGRFGRTVESVGHDLLWIGLLGSTIILYRIVITVRESRKRSADKR